MFRNFLLKTVVIGTILISLLVWPSMVMSYYQYGFTMTTMKKGSLHMSDSTGQDGDVSDIFLNSSGKQLFTCPYANLSLFQSVFRLTVLHYET